MFLIDAIKLNVEKKFIFFTLLFRGGKSRAYKKTFCSFSCSVCWLQQKHYSKDTGKRIKDKSRDYYALEALSFIY